MLLTFSPISCIVIFSVIWTISFFVMLPLGITPPKDVPVGFDTGAPDNPRIKYTMIKTTILSVVVFGLYCASVLYYR